MFAIAIRLGLVFLLVAWCFRIVQPFLILILWATVITVAVYPAYGRLAAGLGASGFGTRSSVFGYQARKASKERSQTTENWL